MDIVVTGRNVEVPERFREFVTEKISGVERYDGSTLRYEVELSHQQNPRQAKTCQRVQITGKGGGSTVRAEASGPDFNHALGSAVDKLAERLRRRRDKGKVHHGLRQPTSVAEATASLAPPDGPPSAGTTVPAATPTTTEALDDLPDEDFELDGPARIVREKHHVGRPMAVNDALEEMELLGHDFYLFVDAACGRPSVIYRRQAFDYGLIRLTQQEQGSTHG